MSRSGGPMLSVRGLRVDFAAEKRTISALNGVDLHIDEGETVGLVGETGSGKSVTALSVLRLLPSPPARITAGEVLFEGSDLLRLPPSAMRKIRGARISMVFQEPMTSLDPAFTVGSQMREMLAVHLGLRGKAATARALSLLERVRMPHADRVLRQYPFELSGGMRQRVMIAMAVSCSPALLVADEATTALDVTVQAQVLGLLRELQEQIHMSILLITHDLGVVAESCDRVYIMYAGRVVESAAVDALFHEPLHPYTRGLMGAIPGAQRDQRRLDTIPGEVLDPLVTLQGCPFAPRCPHAMARCWSEPPAMREPRTDHATACFLYD